MAEFVSFGWKYSLRLADWILCELGSVGLVAQFFQFFDLLDKFSKTCKIQRVCHSAGTIGWQCFVNKKLFIFSICL